MNAAAVNDRDMQQLIAAHRGGVVRPAGGGLVNSVEKPHGSDMGGAFANFIKAKMDGGVKFSAHAMTRLKSRNIAMTPDMMGKLEKAVNGAAEKGGKDSLILLKNLAFIVNIPNRTVVTAMDGSNSKESVFTNIDSAVVAD